MSPTSADETRRTVRPGDPFPFLAPIALFLCVLVGAAGCSGDEQAPRPPVVRLVDHAGAATFAAQVDLAERDAWLAERRAPVFDGVLEQVPADTRATHEGPWALRLLDRYRAEGVPHALLHTGGAPIFRAYFVGFAREPWMRIAVEAAGAERPTLLLVEVDRAFSGAELANPTMLESMLLRSMSQTRWLQPRGGTPDETVAQLEVKTRGLLVGVFDGPGTRLRVERMDEPAAFLSGETPADPGGTGARNPWVWQVAAGGESRPSVLLAAPATARFPLHAADLPATHGALRLTAGIAAPFSLPGVQVEIVVAAASAGERVETTFTGTLDRTRWQALELDLARLPDGGARRDVEITFTVRALADADAGTFVALGSPVLAAPWDPQVERPPDVVLVSLDTVRADRLSLYDASLATSPNLARLGEAAFVLEQAIAPTPWTLPSHVTLLSGWYPDRHAVLRSTARIASEVPLIATAFRRAGYRTVAVAGGGYVRPAFGFDRGFERFGITDPASPDPEWAATQGRGLQRDAEESTAARHEMLDLLRAPHDRPLFLFLHTYAAHDYRVPPDVLRDLGVGDAEMADHLRALDTRTFNRSLDRVRENAKGRELDLSGLERRVRRLYDGSLRVADALVGDVVRALEEAGRLDSTLIVVVSDHGEELFERGKVGHSRGVYEEVLRIPMLFRGPGVAAGRRNDVVSLADVAPTLLELCGLDRDAWVRERFGSADGRSLVPLMRGAAFPAEPVLARGDHDRRILHALRGAELKYIRAEEAGRLAAEELYRLDSDPGERTNLADSLDQEAARLAEQLQKRVHALRSQAPLPLDTELSAEERDRLRELGYLGD